jgi:hypothetical protein
MNFGGTFDHRGGSLSLSLSDDYLQIPPGAIPTGEQWKVDGKIHTSLDRYKDVCGSDELVAPVIQIDVEQKQPFLKDVTLTIHHAVRDKKDLDRLAVLFIQDNGQQKQIQTKTCYNTSDKTEPWFDYDDNHVFVHTRHFCTVVCKLCDTEEHEMKNVSLKGYLFGQIQRENDGYRALLKFYLHLTT